MGLQKYRADIKGETQKDGAIPWFANWVGGPSLSLIRNCRISSLSGENISPRTVYVSGEPDSYFTLPARIQFKSKMVKGYVAWVDDGYIFRCP